jgi:hypothetical protein
MKYDLAELKKRLEPRSLLALTLESGQMLVSVVRKEGIPGDVPAPLTIPIGADEIVRSPEKAGQALKLALETAGWRENKCAVCIPAAWALTTGTSLPPVEGEDLRGFLEIRAEQEFSLPLAEFRLGYCVYTVPEGDRRATLAVVLDRRLKAIEAMLTVARRRAVSVSLALEDCLADPSPLLHFQANGVHTDVVITGGDGIVAVRSLASPGDAQDDAPFDAATFCREVRITLGRLPPSIRQKVRRARFAGTPEAAERLFGAIQDDLQRLGIDSAEAADPSRHGGAAAESAGQRLRGKAVPFEFIVPEVRRWEAIVTRYDTPLNRKIVAGVLALIVLPVLLFFVRSQYEAHLASRWAQMKDNVAELDALNQKIHSFRPWFEPAPQNLQLIEGLIAAFPEAGDAWAKSIQISPDFKVTCTGFARNQPAILALLDRLRARPDVSGLQVQQFRGDNPVQFSFTYKWSSHS